MIGSHLPSQIKILDECDMHLRGGGVFSDFIKNGETTPNKTQSIPSKKESSNSSIVSIGDNAGLEQQSIIIALQTLANRTKQGSDCPTCAEYGFNPDKDAWFYLMQRPGEQQLGITNVLTDRLRTHERNGWSLIEHTSVPSRGQKVLDTEKAFKKWLKDEIGLMEGTTENWSTTKMEVHSLAELKARSGIETDLF